MGISVISVSQISLFGNVEPIFGSCLALLDSSSLALSKSSTNWFSWVLSSFILLLVPVIGTGYLFIEISVWNQYLVPNCIFINWFQIFRQFAFSAAFV